MKVRTKEIEDFEFNNRWGGGGGFIFCIFEKENQTYLQRF